MSEKARGDARSLLSGSVREPHFDKPDVLTVSGVHRGIQRRIYDKRRAVEIPAHGLRLIVVKPSDLVADRRGRLLRCAAT
jgi:hypothetical protein